MTPALAMHLRPYRNIVVAQMPGCNELDIRRRCGMLYMRDVAQRKILVASEDAAQVLGTLESMAAHHAFRPMPMPELASIHFACTRLMATASSLNGALTEAA